MSLSKIRRLSPVADPLDEQLHDRSVVSGREFRWLGPLAARAPMLIGASAALMLLLFTPLGLDVGYDSVFYLSAAENLLQGDGLSRLSGGGEVIPLTHFPPLYPLLISALGLVGLEPAVAARWLSALLLGFNVWLAGWIVSTLSSSRPAGLATSLLVLFSPVLLDRHLEAMSEPLYFFLLQVALVMLARTLNAGRREVFIAAAVISGAAYLARYTGAALLATGALGLLLWLRQPWKMRVARTAIYLTIAFAPMAAWMARNFTLTGTTTNRVLRFHPLGSEQLRQAAATMGSWLTPVGVTARAGFVLLLLAGIGLLVLWWRTGRQAPEPAPDARVAQDFLKLVVLHAVIYLGFLAISLSFFDASTRLGDRILAPLYLLGVLLAGVLIGLWLRRGASRWVFALLLVLSAFIVLIGGRSLVLLLDIRSEGRGFNSARWTQSEGVAFISSMPAEAVIYTDEAFPVYYRTGRPVYSVPEAVDPVKGEPRADYPQQLDRMRSRLMEGPGVLVLFHPDATQLQAEPFAELIRELEVIGSLLDSIVYGLPSVRDQGWYSEP